MNIVARISDPASGIIAASGGFVQQRNGGINRLSENMENSPTLRAQLPRNPVFPAL
jgi:hypothetical protein